MKNCVIYGAWLKDSNLINTYLTPIKSSLGDCDFYVGFNNSTNKDFINSCLNNLNVISYKICDKEMETNSDASAYQAALQSYKENRKEKYCNTYFIHNKGASHFTHAYINDYLIRFLLSRNEIDEALKSYGGYCLYGGICDDISTGWNDMIKNTSRFLYDIPVDVM